jgi:arsenate reductase (thioredoxin)
MNKKPRVLFLCTGNSCRSQMAEGFCRYYKSKELEPYSAGIEKHGLNKYAVKVMKKIGIDVSNNKSKTLSELSNTCFEYVITVCDHANETCPFFPAKIKVIHHRFDDPPKLAEQLTDNEAILAIYRRVRDEIKNLILMLPDNLNL